MAVTYIRLKNNKKIKIKTVFDEVQYANIYKNIIILWFFLYNIPLRLRIFVVVVFCFLGFFNCKIHYAWTGYQTLAHFFLLSLSVVNGQSIVIKIFDSEISLLLIYPW